MGRLTITGVRWPSGRAGARRTRIRVACLAGGRPRRIAAGALLALGAAGSAAQAPPDERWRTIDTPHFRVTFPERLEDLGRRAGATAERLYRALDASFLEAPEIPVDILVTDHADRADGWARTWPSNRVLISARPPVESLSIGYYEDWFELVLAHELAHVFHLDTADRATRLGRALFGRSPSAIAFPAFWSPSWVIEGIATWFESTLTGAGRLHGTYHDMILRTAALEGRFETPGQAAGRSPEWPGGTRPYVYGAAFFDHLDRTRGRDAVGDFAQETAGQFAWARPLDAAGERSFGAVSRAWETWAEELEAAGESLADDLAARAPITVAETLTRGARRGLHAAVAPDGRSVVYLRADGRSDVRFARMPAAGGATRSVARVNGVTRPAFLPDGGLVFSQRDYVDRYRLASDIYIVTPDDRVRRVTAGARLTAPSPGPDGTWAVAVVWRGQASGLVRVDLGDGATSAITATEAGTHWALPAVSPNGRWIAATMWRDGLQDLVLLDMTGQVRQRLTRDRALDIAPSWSPGGDYLLWTSDRTGIPNVVGAAIDPDSGASGPPAMLTNVVTGAAYPSLDPAAEWLYFSGYHADGWEVERTPFRPHEAAPAPAPLARFREAAGRRRDAGSASSDQTPPARPYAALDTLLPRYWLPVLTGPVTAASTTKGGVEVPRKELIGSGIGAATSGFDLVGRHAYRVTAGHHPSEARSTAAVTWDYRGFGNPWLGIRAGQTWREDGARVLPAPGDAPPAILYVLERERRLAGAATFERRRLRSNLAVSLTAGFVESRREFLDLDLAPVAALESDRPRATLGELSASVAWSNARSHTLQMGNARGVSLSARLRSRADLDASGALAGDPGVDRSVDDVVAELRGYWPLAAGGRFAAPVLAVRARAGAARGARAGRGHFDVGGAMSRFAVRGYADAAQSGSRVWTASLEYRLPLASINRGVGTWPLHMNRVFAVAYADAGLAWEGDAPSGDRPDTLRSVGVELAADVLAMNTPYRLRAGVAAPLAADEDGAMAYLAFGLAF